MLSVGIYAIKTLSDVGKQSKMQGMGEWQAFLKEGEKQSKICTSKRRRRIKRQ
jgi:hypothetical protein